MNRGAAVVALVLLCGLAVAQGQTCIKCSDCRGVSTCLARCSRTCPGTTNTAPTTPAATAPTATAPGAAKRPAVTAPIATRPAVTGPIATRPSVTGPIATAPGAAVDAPGLTKGPAATGPSVAPVDATKCRAVGQTAATDVAKFACELAVTYCEAGKKKPRSSTAKRARATLQACATMAYRTCRATAASPKSACWTQILKGSAACSTKDFRAFYVEVVEEQCNQAAAPLDQAPPKK